MPKVLVDADVLAKLAHWDLLEELPEMLGISWNEMATVPSLVFRCRTSATKADGKLFHSELAAKRALFAVEKMLPLPEIDAQEVAWVQDNAQIDPGEAVLFSIARRESATRILTGDKRALRALATLDVSVLKALQGKILIVEQVLAHALAKRGVTYLRQHVCPFKELDIAIGNIMGSRCDATEDSIKEGLASYIGEMQGLTTPPLVDML